MADRPLGIIRGSGRLGKPRKLDSVVSVRLDGPLLAEARRLAKAEAVPLSDWIRAAVVREVAGQRDKTAPRVCGWSCQHMTITSVPGLLGNVTAGCGCDMQPIYEQVA